MSFSDAMGRCREAYGPKWHMVPPLDADQVRVQGETDLGAAAPVAGNKYRVCSVRVPINHAFVLHSYELRGYQDRPDPADPAFTIKEELASAAIRGKLSWSLVVAAERTAYRQSNNIAAADSEGHGKLGSFSVRGGNLQPVIVVGSSTIEISVKGIDPAFGVNISPLGGQLIGELAGYFIPLPK